MSESFKERAFTFECEADTLIGIIAQPEQPIGQRGVLIVVGGPQYRAGSHRQFLLLSRHLASQGIPTMRFDYRGMGDSSGALRDFETVSPDIRAAVDWFVASVPEVKEVVLWGLCDAATAVAFYAYRDPRITGVVLLNPWVRTQKGEAKVYLKHYYFRRLFDGEFWSRVFSGRFDLAQSLRGLLSIVGRAVSTAPASEGGASHHVDLIERMAFGLQRFPGKALLVLSGNDLMAREFVQASKHSLRLQQLLARNRFAKLDVDAANHTFSTRRWRDEVARETSQWTLRA